MKKVVVVGGVAGGMSCATRIKRLDSSIEVTVFEQDRDVSFANCGMPYYIGGVIADRDALLVQTPQGIMDRYDVDVRVRHRVTSIDRDARTVTVHDIENDRDLVFPWDYLVLSPGAYPIKPPLPGIDRPNVHILKNLDDMDRIRAATVAAKRAVVVGGGYIGIEVAENLRHAGVEVDVVERLDYLMPAMDPEMTRLLLGELRMRKVNVHLGREVTAFSDAGVHIGGGGRMPVPSDDGHMHASVPGDGTVIPADFSVVSVGVKPVSKLAVDAGLTCTPSGHIIVDKHMRTSDPSIFAVGDAIAACGEKAGCYISNPLAGPANRQGRIAADNICGRESTYKGTQGTAIAKVFNLSAAGTGHNEKQLTAEGVKYHRAYIHPTQHPGYYPGAALLAIKLLFDDDGMILGAQVIGREGADVVINSIAQAMRARQTVYDLEEVELAYCPAWGNAKHPVNMVGFVAANILRGDVEILEPWEEPDVWLDVREPDESCEQIPGSINIPLGQIAGRLAEIPKDKLVGIYCATGLRSYLAYRRLKQLGYNVRNLNGGFRTWNWFARPGDLDRPPVNIKAPSPGCVPGISVFKTNHGDQAGTTEIPDNGPDTPEI